MGFSTKLTPFILSIKYPLLQFVCGRWHTGKNSQKSEARKNVNFTTIFFIFLLVKKNMASIFFNGLIF
jgi:hypothetical protein